MSLADNKQTAKAFLEHAFSGRMDAAIAMLTDDVRWWVIGDPAFLRVAGEKDRAKSEKLLRGLARAIPEGMRVELHGMTAEDDRVAVEAEGWGIWHNGRPYHNRYHILLRVRGGSVCEIHEYMDTLHVYQTLAP
jgi:ketosteroid isomerase-like protein